MSSAKRSLSQTSLSPDPEAYKYQKTDDDVESLPMGNTETSNTPDTSNTSDNSNTADNSNTSTTAGNDAVDVFYEVAGYVIHQFLHPSRDSDLNV